MKKYIKIFLFCWKVGYIAINKFIYIINNIILLDQFLELCGWKKIFSPFISKVAKLIFIIIKKNKKIKFLIIINNHYFFKPNQTKPN